MPTTSYALCNFCDASCGLTIEHEEGRVLSVRGDELDPFSQGHICPKGVSQGDLHHDPDRLREPMRRRGSSWERIPWDEAIDEVGRRLAGVQREHGDDAVGFYFGNPVAHRHSTLLALIPFAKWLRTKNVFSANSLDSFPRTLVSWMLYGNQALLPVPDLDRTRFLLVLGANPVISNGSVMSAPDIRGRLKALRARGGRLVVIDPRRTETADMADVHHFIRPGTDALLLTAMLHVLFAEGRVRLGALEGQVEGLERLEAIVGQFSPARVASHVGISAQAIEALARDFASAESAVCYGRMGTCTQEFGSLATWLIDMLNLLTGNMDRVGGAMFNSPAVDLGGLAQMLGQTGAFGRYKSRVGGLAEFNGEFPVAALADELETPGPGQIRAFVTLAGNPVLSAPNGRRLERAFQGLDFMVSIDMFLNETTRMADIVLPVPSPLECDHYPLLEFAIAVRNVAHYSQAVFPRPPEVKEDWEVLLEVMQSIGRHRGRVAGVLGGLARGLGRTVGPERVIDALLRTGPQRRGPHRLTLERLKANPHGIDLGPMEPRLLEKLRRARRHIPLVPELLEADLPRLHALLERDAPGVNEQGRRKAPGMERPQKRAAPGMERPQWQAAPGGKGPQEQAAPGMERLQEQAAPGMERLQEQAAPGMERQQEQAASGTSPTTLQLVSRRTLRSMNSWLHNNLRLVKGKSRCTLLMHPEDALLRRLEDGMTVRVASRVGSIEVPLQVSDEVMPGVVSLPYGWGHGREGSRMTVAERFAGSSMNDVVDDQAYDRVSGVAVLDGIPVSVSAA